MLQADYITSIVDFKQSPNKKGLDEVAFWGRSNVGKSSLINLITQKKSLAKTSNTPGKTKCINYFLLQNKIYLVDLPGYGYAKISIKEREKWLHFTFKYLIHSEQLSKVFLLIDSRLPPQQIDLDRCGFLEEHSIPYSLVFTKTDKQKSHKIINLERLYREFLVQNFLKNEIMFYHTSTKDKTSIDHLVKSIYG